MADFIEATPANGDVRHAIRVPTPEQYSNSPRWTLQTALCGVRGRDSWAMGGMVPVRDADGEFVPFTATDPNPKSNTDWKGRAINQWCPRCIGRVRRLRKAAEAEVSDG